MAFEIGLRFRVDFASTLRKHQGLPILVPCLGPDGTMFANRRHEMDATSSVHRREADIINNGTMYLQNTLGFDLPVDVSLTTSRRKRIRYPEYYFAEQFGNKTSKLERTCRIRRLQSAVALFVTFVE